MSEVAHEIWNDLLSFYFLFQPASSASVILSVICQCSAVLGLQKNQNGFQLGINTNLRKALGFRLKTTQNS